MARQIPEPFDPSPDIPYHPPPKHREPTFPVGRDEQASSMAEQGRPLPIAYGTVKLPVLCIEKLVPFSQDPPPWTASTSYSSTGYLVKNGNSAYELITPGLSAASGGPSGTGADIVDGGAHWKYRQDLPFPVYYQRFIGALCEGQIQAGLNLWVDKEKFAAVSGTLFIRAIELKLGPDAGGQLLTPGMGWDSAGYPHVALIQPLSGAVGIPSGTQKELPNVAVEVQAVMLGASTPDVNPADIVNDLLTHVRRGVVWPSSRVDSSITGTAASGMRVYCDAAGFRFSMALTEARSALAWIEIILKACNCEAVWSGGALKASPLGDQAISSPVYGATGYTPANTPIYDLTLDDFLDQDFPVQVNRRDDADCFNTWPVQFIDRNQAYAKTTVEDPEQIDVDDRGGKRVAQTLALPMVFPDGKYPVMLSRILAKRSLKNRNTYTFRLGYWSMLLEPTDIVTLPAEVIGVKTTVRITSMQEDPGRGFTFTAMDYATAAQAAAAYQPQPGDGYKANEASTVSSAGPLAGVMKTADRNVTVGIYPYSSAWGRILRALDGDAVNQGGLGLYWYRGNIDPSDSNQGKPIIGNPDGLGERLRVFGYNSIMLFNGVNTAVIGTSVVNLIKLEFDLQPRANTDNLDALRQLQLHFFTDTGTDTGEFWYIQFPDRSYKTPGTPSDPGNLSFINTPAFVTGGFQLVFTAAPNLPRCYIRGKLFNAYGESAERDYQFTVNTVTAANWREATYGTNIIPGAPAPGTGSGGGGSSYCPTPDALIALPGDKTIRAGDLVEGMEVLGFKERDFEHPMVGTIRYLHHDLAKMLYAVKLTDGRVLRYSKDHRLCSLERGWTAVQDLRGGEELVARRSSVVESVHADGPGYVVGFVVEGTHTYFTDDVLSHNAKQQLP